MSRHALKRAFALVSIGVVVATPALALACPYCAAGNPGSSGLRVALGAFLLLPFGVAVVVYTFLRREAE
jgi:hypothetical protein